MFLSRLNAINGGVPALFGKIDFYWSAVDISICLHLSVSDKFAYSALYQKSFLRFAYPRLKNIENCE